MPNTTADIEMKGYYKERAPVYDRVYAYPERQADLRYLESLVSEYFTGLEVLEVAAGTGYWTQFISRQAHSVLATDATPEALDQVNNRNISNTFQTQVIDAYKLDTLQGSFNGAFAGLWFSHIPVQQRTEWFGGLHSKLKPGAKVLLLDNSRAQCKRLPVTHTDEEGNTYQDRQTDSGEIYRVLKNFPQESEMIALTANVGGKHKFTELEHYWYFEYVSI